MNKSIKPTLVIRVISRFGTSARYAHSVPNENSSHETSGNVKKFDFKSLPAESQKIIDRIIRVDHAGESLLRF